MKPEVILMEMGVISYCRLLEVLLRSVTSDQIIQVLSLENSLLAVALNVSFPHQVTSKPEFVFKDICCPYCV